MGDQHIKHMQPKISRQDTPTTLMQINTINSLALYMYME